MRQTRRPHNPEIPTASMADVAFLLVVFFMVTLTLASQRGLDFRPAPEEEVDNVDPIESVLVEILADNSLRVDGRSMALEGLLPYLAPKLEVNPNKPVILRPTGDSRYGQMVVVFDTLRSGEQRLGLSQAIQIALPTEREIASYW